MNVALWVLQSLLAVVFLGAGMTKLAKHRQALLQDPRMAWANDFTGSQLKMIGVAEVLGAIALVLPWALGTIRVLTPLGAVGLASLMVGAVATHVKRREPPVVAGILAVLSACVALGRVVIR